MLSPNSGPKRDWKRPVLWTVAALFVIGLGVVAKPAYRSLKTHRANKIAAESEALIASGRWEEALQKAQSAIQLSGQDPRAFAVAARILGHFGREEALGYWDMAFARKKPSANEMAEAITLALQLKRLDVVEVYLSQFLQQTPIVPEALRLAAIYCEVKGDPIQAVKFARAWLGSQPDDIDMLLLLSRQLLATRQPAGVREAKVLLWEIARLNHPASAKALALLAYTSDLGREELKECLQRISVFPGEDIARDFVMRDLQLRLEPKRRPEIIAAAIRQDQKGGPLRLLSLTRWLSQKGEFKAVIDAVAVNVILTNRDLFLTYSDAMAGLGRWTQLEALFARDDLPLEPVLTELYRARVAKELKKDRQAETHWARVQWLATNNPGALRYVADYAEKLGETAESVKAYRKLVRDPKSSRAAYLALVRLANQKHDTAELRRIMQELVALYPNDPVPRIDLAYLQLLARENLSSARSVAKDLYQKQPDMLACRATLALAYLRNNELAAARDLFKDIKLESLSISPGWQAVYVAVLGANGDKNAAHQLARVIPSKQLKAEERALVEPWL